MSELFFDDEVFDREIAKKLSSLQVEADDLMRLLVRQLEETHLTSADLEKIKYFYRHLSVFPFDTLYPNYLTHPIRVAASYARMLGEIRVDDIVLALCHNVKEAGFVQEIDPNQEFLSPEVRHCIDLLTIDRTRERDKPYLKDFYDCLEASTKNLMLFKALDKLDNTLSYVLDELEYYHAEIVLDFVCPRIASSHSKLESYLRNLTLYVWTDEAKSKFRNGMPAFKIGT